MNIFVPSKFRIVGLAAMLIILLSACGSAESTSPTDTPAPPPPEPTSTSVPPTETPAPTPTPEDDGVVYEDPGSDCLDNGNVPTACVPLGVDILTVTITQESPLTIVIELAADGRAGVAEGDTLGVIFGIDLDRDMTTGYTSFWPELHGIGPDLDILWTDRGGFVSQNVRLYAADGTRTDGDASLTVWTWLDDNHVQVVISDELLTSASFGISGDVYVTDLYDHFVDNGHLTFPEGEVILVE